MAYFASLKEIPHPFPLQTDITKQAAELKMLRCPPVSAVLL